MVDPTGHRAETFEDYINEENNDVITHPPEIDEAMNEALEELVKAQEQLDLYNECFENVSTTDGPNRYDEVEALLNTYYSEEYDNYIDGSVRLVYPMWTESRTYNEPNLMKVVNSVLLFCGLTVAAELIGGYFYLYGGSSGVGKVLISMKATAVSTTSFGLISSIFSPFLNRPFIPGDTTYNYYLNAQFGDTSYGAPDTNAYFNVSIPRNGTKIDSNYNPALLYVDKKYRNEYGYLGY